MIYIYICRKFCVGPIYIYMDVYEPKGYQTRVAVGQRRDYGRCSLSRPPGWPRILSIEFTVPVRMHCLQAWSLSLMRCCRRTARIAFSSSLKPCISAVRRWSSMMVWKSRSRSTLTMWDLGTGRTGILWGKRVLSESRSPLAVSVSIQVIHTSNLADTVEKGHLRVNNLAGSIAAGKSAEFFHVSSSLRLLWLCDIDLIVMSIS